MSFVPIDIESYIALHIRRNPSEDRDDLRERLLAALSAKQSGELCDCGNPIWVIGSAIAGHACFTCITLEAAPDHDYEIADACDSRDA